MIESGLQAGRWLVAIAVASVIIVGCSWDSSGDSAAVDRPRLETAEESGERAEVPAVSWSELRRRPVRPAFGGRGCRATPARTVTEDVGLAAGERPVYVVLGYPVSPPDPEAVVLYRTGYRRGRAFGHKVLWVISPDHDQRVLIRGRERGIRKPLQFQSPTRPNGVTGEQRLPAITSRSSGWRTYPSAVYIHRAGCYALQLDGAGFSTRVIFKAVD